MPRLPDDHEQGGRLESFADDVHQRASSFWEGFSNFALRDNVLEVAVGLMYDFLMSASILL